MLVAAYGLVFLTGLMLNGSTVFLISCGKERSIDRLWSLNLAIVDFIFVALLPLRVWAMNTSSEILLTLNSSLTALHVVSRACFLAATAASCAVSVASPAWLEQSQASPWAFAATLVIWALSFALSVRYHDLWEAVMLSQDPKMDLDEWTAMRSLSTSFLIWFLGLLTLMIMGYSVRVGKEKPSCHTWFREPLKRLFIFLLTFSLCWLPYHVLYFLLVLWLDSPAWSSPGVISGCQVAYLLPYFSSCWDAITYLSTTHLQQSGGRLTLRHQRS
ncbi:chemerin-like receptor 1 [Paroedura picta]|uniref:chemerin-like receptor 1 n=1 Tax=Paroedura picta TaxID=143630 RepID=UPI0040563A6F